MKTKMRRIAIILSFALVFSVFPFSATAGSGGNGVSQAIQQYIESDGYVAEGTSAHLEELFRNDPVTLVIALSQFDADAQDRVARTLTYYASVGTDEEYEAFSKALAIVKESAISTEQSELIALFDTYLEEALSIEVQTSSPIIAPVFSVKIVKRFIDGSKKKGFPKDEELGTLLATYYRQEPKLFMKAMENMNGKKDAQAVAEIIAYAEANAKRLEISAEPVDESSATLSPAETQLLNVLDNQIQNTSIGYSVYNTSVRKGTTQVPDIGILSYPSKVNVGETDTLAVSFSETTAQNVDRSYYAEVWNTKDGIEYLKEAKQVTIPAGSADIAETFDITQYQTGEFVTEVKVFSNEGGALLKSFVNPASSMAAGTWEILVLLPEYRINYGRLYLYGAGGPTKFNIACLGRGTSGGQDHQTAKMDVTNGDTVFGEFNASLAGPDNDTAKMGPYKYVQLRVVNAGQNDWITEYRTDTFAIHAGRNQSSLSKTNGCVRIFNDDQLRLEVAITSLIEDYNHDRVGYCEIAEW